MKAKRLAFLVGAGISAASLAPEVTQAATWGSIHGNNRSEPQEHPGAEAIPYGPTVYYYGAGAFYVQNPQGFVVVQPPPGIASQCAADDD